MYTGPSPRSLGSSLVLHGAVVAALLNVPVPVAAPKLVATDPSHPTEIRIAGHLYYVSQIQGSQTDAAKPASSAARRAAPRAAAAGPAALPKLPYVPAPKLAVASRAAPLPATAAPAPLPEPARILREQARAFIPPQLRPNPAATQTLIQPLAPLDVTPPPTPLPNFRITADVSQMRRIPKPFLAPGRVTPPTPPQSPNVDTPAPDLVPSITAPPGEPLTILSLNDHPIPFSERVVVPAGNIAQPPGQAPEPAAGAAGAAGGTAAGASGGVSGGTNSAPASSAAGTATGSPAGSANAAPANSAASARAGAAGNATGRGTTGAGTGAALTGGAKTGDTVIILGGLGGVNGINPGITPGINPGNTPGNTPGNGGAGNAPGNSAGAGAGATGAGGGAARTNAPGASATINRPPQGTFDAVVVQAAPTDQYPESRGLLSGRPIYSVYVPVGTAREWTLFFCVPGEKPEPGNGAVINLGAIGRPVKAPYPTKLVRPQITLPSWEKYVLVHGIVNKEGHFENLRVVRSIKPETDHALLLSLSEWVFRAASREGAPIAVEFLLSIPARGL